MTTTSIASTRAATIALIVSITGMLTAMNARADIPTAWSQSPPSPGYDEANAIALDAQGNVYVTGQSGPISSGPGCCNGDFVTIKYNASGVQQWRAVYDGPAHGPDVATSLVVDGLGNVYVSGSSGTAVGASGTISGSDIVVVKYSPQGVPLWADTRYNGPGNGEDTSENHSLAVDRAGNVYVTGASEGTGTNQDIVTIKYNASGVRLWVVRYSGPGSPVSNDRGRALFLDQYRNVFVAGRSTGVDGLADFVTFKYNQDGQQRWLARFDGVANGGVTATNAVDFPNDITVDRTGNVIVTGESHLNIQPTDILRSSGKGDFVTVKYSASGQQLWSKRFDGSAHSDDYRPVIAVDAFAGNIYVAGISQGTGTDYATIKYSPAGNEVWASPARFSGPNGAPNPNDSANAIALDLFGDIYVTGAAPESIPSGGFTDLEATTVKYNASGILQWVQRYRNFRSAANAIAVDRARNVFIAGWTFNFVTPTTNDLDYAVVKNTINYVGPVAEFDYSPATPIEKQPVQFTDQSTQPSTWAWDFDNDGIVNSTLQNPTFTFATPGSYAVTLTVTNPLASPPPVTHTVVVESTSNIPYVDSVVRQYPGYFLQGTTVQNKFDALIIWKGDPGTAAFQVEFGTAVVEPGNLTGASHTFNMATDFAPGFAGSTVSISPTNFDGLTGLPRNEKLYLFPLPPWLAAAKELFPDVLKFVPTEGEIKAELKKSFPDNPLEKSFLIPESVPYIGGKFGVGLQSTFSGSISSTGIGSLKLEGKGLFEAAKGKAKITASGSGTFRLLPPEGLILQKASFGLGITGTIKKEQGLVEAIPQLAPLQALPVIGGAVSWLNDRAKLVGEISPKIELEANFKQEDGLLAFSDGKGKLGCDLKATLEVEITANISASAWVGGGGEFKLGVPVTETAPLLREGTLKFEAGAKINVDSLLQFSREAKFTAECTWKFDVGTICSTGPSSASSGNGDAFRLATEDAADQISVIEPDYDRFGEYSRFQPMKLAIAASALVPVSMSETALMTNVFKGASPNLVALTGGPKLLLFATQDPAAPVLQSTDISWSFFNGTTWSAPATIISDTQAELSPVAADANGKVVAVWTRIKDSTFTTPINTASDLPLFYKRLEVVSATFDVTSLTWSTITQLTDDTALDTDLSLASDGAGNMLLTWLSNPFAEFMSTASSPSTLKYSVWNGSSWSAPAVVASGLAGVNSHVAAARGSNAFVIVPRDPDPFTSNDGVLDLYTWNGTSWSTASTFAAGGVENRLTTAVYDTAGTGHVVWVRGDDLVHATLTSPTPQVVRAGSASLSFYDTKLLVNAAGNLTLLRHDSVDNGPANIIATLYDATRNSWSADRRLTADPGKATALSAAFGSDGKIHGAYLSTVITRVTKTVTIEGKEVPIDNIPEDGQTDLRVFEHALITDLAVANDDLQITPGSPRLGDVVDATLTVHNAGNFATGSFAVRFYAGDPNAGGVLLTTSVVPAPFRAGDVVSVSVSFTYPASGGDIIAIVDADNAVSESSETNNRAAVLLASNAAPEAVIIPNFVGGPAPLTVNFNGFGSFDSDGDPLSFAWSFSDGTASATGMNVNHTFTNGGQFPVTLSVRDGRGGVGTNSVLITVTGGAPQPPTITGFTPTSGPAGTSVVITGTNFTGTTSVTFNGLPATFSVTSATQISATVPSGATSGAISVTTPDGTATSSSSFTVITPAQPPTITSFTPTSGAVGATVTITGTNFTGTTSVTFNGLSATFSVTSATQISATVPTGATNGAISVTTPDGTATSSTSFTVVPVTGARRGDANGDNEVTSADIFFLINHLFAAGPAPAGISGDANNDTDVTATDVFFLINFLFANGPSPAP